MDTVISIPPIHLGAINKISPRQGSQTNLDKQISHSFVNHSPKTDKFSNM